MEKRCENCRHCCRPYCGLTGLAIGAFEAGKYCALHELKSASTTIPVRIAVVVHPHGEWYAVGRSGYGEEAIASEAAFGIKYDPRRVVSFVTASVPLPQSVEVRGEVQQ